MEVVIILLMGSLTRLIFMVSTSSDFDVHTWLFKHYQRGGSLSNKKVPNSVVENGFVGYPPLPTILISKVKESLQIPVGIITNIGLDLVVGLCIYILTGYLVKEGIIHNSPTIISTPGIVTLLYLTSPILHPISARLKAMGGRTLSSFLLLLYFVCLGFAWIDSSWILYLACILLGILIILTSEFGMQVLVFFSLGLAVYYFSWEPLVLVILVFGIGLLIPSLGLRKQLFAKISHYKWYTSSQLRGTLVDSRNSLKNIITLPYNIFKNPQKSIDFLFKNFSFFIVLYSIPPVTIFLYWYFSGVDFTWISQNSTLGFYAAISLVSGVVFILTSLKPFLFLGQAERYFEFSLPFMILLLMETLTVMNVSSEIYYLLILLQVGIIMLNFVVSNLNLIKENFNPKHEASLSQLLQFLDSLPPRRIFCIPTKTSFKIDAFLKQRHFSYLANAIIYTEKGLQYSLKDEISYGLVKPDFNYFKEKYGLDTLVVSCDYLKTHPNHQYSSELAKSTKIFGNQKFEVFDISKF